MLQKNNVNIAKAKAFTLVIAMMLISSPISAQHLDKRISGDTASRIKKSNVSGVEVVEFNLDIVTTIEIPGVQFTSCQASITQEYYQRNTFARVSSNIENTDCSKSQGSFNTLLSIRGDDGESYRLEFNEVWQQTENNEVEFTRDYSIGEKMRLLRVRTQDVRCECEVLLSE